MKKCGKKLLKFGKKVVVSVSFLGKIILREYN